MLFRDTQMGSFELWTSDQPIGGVIYPPEIESLWTPAELAAIDLYVPAEAAPVPDGKQVKASRVERGEDGVVRMVHELEDIPPAPRQPLEPWRFWAILDMPGGPGSANLRAAINAHPNPVFKAIANARLNNPPGGAFNRGDAMFSDAALLGAMGMTSANVDQLWDAAGEIPDPNGPT